MPGARGTLGSSAGLFFRAIGPGSFFAGYVTNWIKDFDMAVLKQGSRGAPVKKLQKQLNSFKAKLVVDGIFGPLTEQAVRAFQKKSKLVVDGLVGRQTLAMLGLSGSGAKSTGRKASGGGGVYLYSDDWPILNAPKTWLSYNQMQKDYAKGWASYEKHAFYLIDKGIKRADKTGDPKDRKAVNTFHKLVFRTKGHFLDMDAQLTDVLQKLDWLSEQQMVYVKHVKKGKAVEALALLIEAKKRAEPYRKSAGAFTKLGKLYEAKMKTASQLSLEFGLVYDPH